MSLFRTPSTRQINIGLAVLRVILGIAFTVHGYQKVFDMGIGAVTGGFTKMGIPIPEVTAPAIAILEFFGGIALIAGFLSRPLALAFAADMFGAIMFVHLKNGFSGQGGYELVLLLFAASMAILFAGGGALSVDSLIASRIDSQSGTRGTSSKGLSSLEPRTSHG